MDINVIAMLKTKEEFFAAYSPEYIRKTFDDESLLFWVLRNTKPDIYDMANFLLDEGIDCTVRSRMGSTALHPLFGRINWDLDATIALTKRLIDGGVDVNALDKKNTSALVWIINHGEYSEEELAPLYDLWFSQPQTVLTAKSKYGKSPLDLAYAFNRPMLVERMQKALALERQGDG